MKTKHLKQSGSFQTKSVVPTARSQNQVVPTNTQSHLEQSSQ